MRTGAWLLPFVNDFVVFASGFDETIHPKDETFALVNLGTNIHPTKGYHAATQVGENLGMEMDFKQGVFLAPVKKLTEISVFARDIHRTAAANKRRVPVKALASLFKKSQFVHLVIFMSRCYL
jgi:hypothetical protein